MPLSKRPCGGKCKDAQPTDDQSVMEKTDPQGKSGTKKRWGAPSSSRMQNKESTEKADKEAIEVAVQVGMDRKEMTALITQWRAIPDNTFAHIDSEMLLNMAFLGM